MTHKKACVAALVCLVLGPPLAATPSRAANTKQPTRQITAFAVPARPGIQPWKLVKTHVPRPSNAERRFNGEATLTWLPIWNRTVVSLYRAGEDRVAYEIHVSGKRTGTAGFKGLVK